MDVDIVSDLSNGSDVINANEGNVPATGADSRELNSGAPREPTQQPTKLDTPVTDKPLSLREQISSALKGEATTPPVAQQDGGPLRNPDGTFAAKPAEVPVEPVGALQPASPPVAPAGIDPQVFASLPAETQAQLARTMDDLNGRQQRYASLEPIEQLIAPRVDAWAMNGMAPAQAIHQLLALSDFAGRDPGGFIKYIAENNGVDLEELVLGMEPVAPVDPRVAALEQELNELRGTVQGQTQQQQQAAHDALVGNVVTFASEKGQDGNLLRPHFDALGDAVLPYISMVKAQNPQWPHNQVLQEAYDRACWGTPAVRAKMQAAADAAGAAERLRADAQRVTAARTASTSVPSGTPTAAPLPPDSPQRSLRDTIKASIAAVT